MADTQEPTFEGWAIVELMGHRVRAGRVRPVELFGTKMLRIDVPNGDDDAAGYETQFYAGQALYALTPTDEATARRRASLYRPAPVSRQLSLTGPGDDVDAEYDDDSYDPR